MKDREILIEKYEEIRDICVELYDIADRHPEVKQVHDSLIEMAGVLMDKAHELYKDAYKLKETDDE